MADTIPMHNPDTGMKGDIHPDEVENLKSHGWRLSAAALPPPPPLPPVPDGEPTDADLRAAIKAATGIAPGPNTKRETLLAQYRTLTIPA